MVNQEKEKSIQAFVEAKDLVLEDLHIELKIILKNILTLISNQKQLKLLYLNQEYAESGLKKNYSKRTFSISLMDEYDRIENATVLMERNYKKFLKMMSINEEDIVSDFTIMKRREVVTLIRITVVKIINILSNHCVDLEAFSIIFEERNEPQLSSELKKITRNVDVFQEEAIDYISFLISMFNLDYQRDVLEQEEEEE